MTSLLTIPADTSQVPIFGNVISLLARLSTRMALDSVACRDEVYLRAVVEYGTVLTLIARILKWLPDFLRPCVVYCVLWFTDDTS